MTLEEIQYSKINPLVSREAYDQASKRLADALDTKKAFEQKAFILFNAYIALSLALFGVGGTIYRGAMETMPAWPFLVAGSMLLFGSALFVWALLDKGYGSLASDPDMWLNKGTIDGEDGVVPLMLAYITFYHKDRITKSMEANDLKARLIRFGIFFGLAAPIPLLALLIHC